jgi:hypothetical protein
VVGLVLRRLVSVLGACLPVAVVGGVVLLSRLADPPEGDPPEERELVELGDEVIELYYGCNVAVDYVEGDTVEKVEQIRDSCKKQVEAGGSPDDRKVADEIRSVAEEFSKDWSFRKKVLKAVFRLPENVLNKAFSDKRIGRLLDSIRSLASVIERTDIPWREKLDTMTASIRSMRGIVRDCYALCLKYAGVIDLMTLPVRRPRIPETGQSGG